MSLTPFERMARGLASRWFAMVTLDLRAYVDDSETLGTFSVLAGFVAAYDDWIKFDAKWRQTLREDGLTEFKAHDCEKGQGEFEKYKGYEGKRRQICERYVSHICKANIWGVAVAFDLQAYDVHKPRLQELRGPTMGKKAGDPYFLAFQWVLQYLTRVCEGMDPQETIRVTFDNKPGFSGMSKNIYDELMASDITELDYRKRLDSGFGFDDSKKLPGLQAADLLAYEAKKRCEERLRDDPKRWQFDRLWAKGRSALLLGEGPEMERIMGVMEDNRDPRVDTGTR
jgi:Protein of unknown function (DUF3800)